VHGFHLNFLEGWGVAQETVCYILLMIVVRIQDLGIFIYNCSSYRESRIKLGSSRRRFELSECFLMLLLLHCIIYSEHIGSGVGK